MPVGTAELQVKQKYKDKQGRNKELNLKNARAQRRGKGRGRLDQCELHLPGSLGLQGLEISVKMHALPGSLFESPWVRTSGKQQTTCNRKTTA